MCLNDTRSRRGTLGKAPGSHPLKGSVRPRSGDFKPDCRLQTKSPCPPVQRQTAHLDGVCALRVLLTSRPPNSLGALLDQFQLYGLTTRYSGRTLRRQYSNLQPSGHEPDEITISLLRNLSTVRGRQRRPQEDQCQAVAQCPQQQIVWTNPCKGVVALFRSVSSQNLSPKRRFLRDPGCFRRPSGGCSTPGPPDRLRASWHERQRGNWGPERGCPGSEASRARTGPKSRRAKREASARAKRGAQNY